MWRLLPIIVLGGWSLHARAADWLASTVASYHRNREPRYNERNWGLGFERDFAQDTRLIGGAHRNSHYRTSVYAGAYTPIRWGSHVRIGALGGVVNGYEVNEKRFLPVVMPLAQIEGKSAGADLIVGTSAIALQVNAGVDRQEFDGGRYWI